MMSYAYQFKGVCEIVIKVPRDELKHSDFKSRFQKLKQHDLEKFV